MSLTSGDPRPTDAQHAKLCRSGMFCCDCALAECLQCTSNAHISTDDSTRLLKQSLIVKKLHLHHATLSRTMSTAADQGLCQGVVIWRVT
eukprot:366181-Chlamydomonas_euryale.AAC.10